MVLQESEFLLQLVSETWVGVPKYHCKETAALPPSNEAPMSGFFDIYSFSGSPLIEAGLGRSGQRAEGRRLAEPFFRPESHIVEEERQKDE